jgi:hypothetical protein
VLQFIQKTLGFGTVCEHDHIGKFNETWAYKIQNLPDLYKILLILNGNMLLPSAQKKFHKFVTIFNQKLQSKNNKTKSVKFNLQNIELLYADFVPTQ